MVDDPSEVIDETEVIVDSDSESPTNEQAAGLSPVATGTTGSGRTGSGGSAYSATDYEVQETVMAPGNEARGGSSSLLWPFPYLESAHQVFNLHVLLSCASSIFTNFSLCLFLLTSLHFSFGLLTLRCPLTAIFHVLIATRSSVFLSTWPNHLSLTSLIFSLIFASPGLVRMSSLLIFSIHIRLEITCKG